MKKLFLSVIAVILLSAQVLAYTYDAKFKNDFYEGFLVSFYQSLQQSLLSQGFKSDNVYMYVSTMRARMNKKELENATWSCVSKYSPTQLTNNSEKIITECFDVWMDKYFFEKNSDALHILKR